MKKAIEILSGMRIKRPQETIITGTDPLGLPLSITRRSRADLRIIKGRKPIQPDAWVETNPVDPGQLLTPEEINASRQQVVNDAQELYKTRNPVKRTTLHRRLRKSTRGFTF